MQQQKPTSSNRTYQSISMLRKTFNNIERPWQLFADRLGLIRTTYPLRTCDGALFELRGGTSDRFSIYEVAIRRDYLSLVHINKGDTVVDIGANIGVFAVTAAKLVGPHGRVIAIEPNTETVARLQRNITINGLSNLAVYEAAVTGEPRPVTLYTGEKSLFSTIMTEVDGRSVSGKLEEVQGLSLTEILAREQLEHVDLLKVDCEGGEYEIFDTTDPVLWTRVRKIVMETHQVGDRQPAELLNKLRSLGYVVQTSGEVLVLASRPD